MPGTAPGGGLPPGTPFAYGLPSAGLVTGVNAVSNAVWDRIRTYRHINPHWHLTNSAKYMYNTVEMLRVRFVSSDLWAALKASGCRDVEGQEPEVAEWCKRNYEACSLAMCSASALLERATNENVAKAFFLTRLATEALQRNLPSAVQFSTFIREHVEFLYSRHPEVKVQESDVIFVNLYYWPKDTDRNHLYGGATGWPLRLARAKNGGRELAAAGADEGAAASALGAECAYVVYDPKYPRVLKNVGMDTPNVLDSAWGPGAESGYTHVVRGLSGMSRLVFGDTWSGNPFWLLRPPVWPAETDGVVEKAGIDVLRAVVSKLRYGDTVQLQSKGTTNVLARSVARGHLVMASMQKRWSEEQAWTLANKRMVNLRDDDFAVPNAAAGGSGRMPYLVQQPTDGSVALAVVAGEGSKVGSSGNRSGKGAAEAADALGCVKGSGQCVKQGKEGRTDAELPAARLGRTRAGVFSAAAAMWPWGSGRRVGCNGKGVVPAREDKEVVEEEIWHEPNEGEEEEEETAAEEEGAEEQEEEEEEVVAAH